MGKKKKWFRKNRICVLAAGALFFSCLALPSEAGVRMRDGSGACAGSAHRIEFSYEDNKLSRVESEEGSLDLESRWEAPVR